MKKYFAALTATALLGSAPYAIAASSTDLTVTGLITPQACLPSLSGGGVIDVGKRLAKDLLPTNHTQLGIYPIQLTVACDGPMTLVVTGVDNRPGTGTSGAWYGLGLTDAGERLGTINVRAKTAVADGATVRLIESVNDGATWRAANWLYPSYQLSVSSTTDLTTPIPVKDLAAALDIYVNIAPANGLTLTNDVKIDGHATFELTYF
jgi:type 1 fimbria pilin